LQKRPLFLLAALAAASEPDLGRAMIDRLKSGIRDEFAEDPMGATVKTVIVASWLFYRAERAHNPKVTSFYDALSYVATSLSVGYSDIFPKTDTGKTLSAAIQTFGPAMAAGIFDEGRDAELERQNRAILERLDRIALALESRA
jgi:hypothetical protein